MGVERVETYLIDDLGRTPEVATMVAGKFNNHADILTELLQWIDTKSLDFISPISVRGYTAKDIKEQAPFMNGVGLYSFLVTLREKPTQGEQIIKSKFTHRAILSDEEASKLLKGQRVRRICGDA